MARKKPPGKPPKKPSGKGGDFRQDPDFKKLQRKLAQDAEFTKQVGQNMQVKGHKRVLDAQIEVLEARFEKATGKKRENLGNLLAVLKRAKEIQDRAFYRKEQ